MKVSFFFFLIHFNPFISICKYSNGEKNPIFLENDINDQLKIDIFSNMAVMVTWSKAESAWGHWASYKTKIFLLNDDN